MRKAAVTSSQLTESLCGGDKGLESSWWSQAFEGRVGGGGVPCVHEFCVFCFVLCVLQLVCMFVGTKLALLCRAAQTQHS